MTGVAILEYIDGGIALLRLGSPDEKVVTLTLERMESIRVHIQTLKAKPPIGLVITGPHQDMFTVGADISLIEGVTDADQGAKFAKQGQDIFLELENLPFPTVAAISGPCVGGGCELVLACKHRIISEQKSSIIGLPEIKLGILPGFGGTQRLPRLIGVAKSLDIILAGKTIRPKAALAARLVDEVIPAHALIERARKVAAGSLRIHRKSLSFFDRAVLKSPLLRSIIKKRAKAHVLETTKGFYPAPLAALEAIFNGLSHRHPDYTGEAESLGKLIVTPESKALIRVFYLTEASKSLGKAGSKHIQQLSTAVIGAGIMGAGIASVLAKAECPVVLKDTSEEALQKAKEHIRSVTNGMKYLSEQEKSFIVNRVEATTQDSNSLGAVGLVVEAIVENLSVKQRVLNDIASKIPDDAIITSNTSSLSISKMADGIVNPQRVVGMHFFNPVEKMPLVEIVMGEKTSDRTIALIAGLTIKLGKFPIIVKDVPGFLINRILTPYLNEAAFLLQEGYQVADIDKAATAFGLPMGPLRLLDEVGLDVAAHVSSIMVEGYGPRMSAPPLTSKLVATGALGKKSGGGFYNFSSNQASPRSDLKTILALPEAKPAEPSLIQDRLLVALSNEAIRCFDEGVAGAPGKEATAQIDLGSIMGFGFPPFRGGILYWVDACGAKNLLSKSQDLAKKHGARFDPPVGLVKRGQSEGEKRFVSS